MQKSPQGGTMFRYFSVVLICGFYGFASSAFANSQSATIPEGFRPHLIHHIQKQASSEYAVESRKASSSNTDYQAKNASHKLALGFGAEGVDVRPEQDPEWRMGMKLSTIGYGEDMQPVASGVMTTSGNRVEVRYGNAESSPEVTEWYLNGPLGLEQGFTLNRPPAGKTQTGHLVLTLTLSGDLTAVPNDDGREVRFHTTHGKTSLRFRDLYVLDATGRQLPSRFILASNGYGIQVDDRSAVYPISIDPLLIKNHHKLTASDAALDDEFGVSVAVSGDTVVVGAQWDDDAGANSGSAYVFVRSGLTWTEQQKLTATDGTGGDGFGGSVSISGDTVVVGAQWDNDEGFQSGSAYVFVRSGLIWTEQQKLTATDAGVGDRFGGSVSISGDTVVVGAQWDDNKGSAYVFVRSGTTWTEEDKLTASDGAELDEFGVSVSVSGDIAVVGAPGPHGKKKGTAYVFVRSGTTWTEEDKLNASDPDKGDDFGESVAIDGNSIVVGAPHNNDKGTAYVFVRSGTTWTQEAKLNASDRARDDHFGESVAISGDTVAVGAQWDNDEGFRSGSAYVFVRSGTIWSQQKKLTARDGAKKDEFGESIAISGDTVVIGARLDDDAGQFSGSAYVHEPETPNFQATLSGKRYCDDGLNPGTGVKEKFKENATFIMGTSNFPEITAEINVPTEGGPVEKFTMDGLALLKNSKSGLLQLFGNDSGSKELSLSGNIKLDKKTGVWVSLKGKFQYQDNGDPVCTLAGKFKAK
jgi:FG-GAP repeat protein